MLKFLLIVGLILYLVYKIGTFFFRAGAASQQQFRQNQRPDGNVNFDGRKPKKDSQFKGGDYIDYEEVK